MHVCLFVCVCCVCAYMYVVILYMCLHVYIYCMRACVCMCLYIYILCVWVCLFIYIACVCVCYTHLGNGVGGETSVKGKCFVDWCYPPPFLHDVGLVTCRSRKWWTVKYNIAPVLKLWSRYIDNIWSWYGYIGGTSVINADKGNNNDKSCILEDC